MRMPAFFILFRMLMPISTEVRPSVTMEFAADRRRRRDPGVRGEGDDDWLLGLVVAADQHVAVDSVFGIFR